MISVLITRDPGDEPDAHGPPTPDFESPIDYDAWIEAAVRGRASPAENAAELYDQILMRAQGLDAETQAIVLSGAGLQSPRTRVPWDPDDEPRLEAVYQASLPLLGLYKRAAEKPYLHFESMRWRAGIESGATTWKLIDLAAWASRVSRLGWRRSDDRPDPREFIDLAAANLGLARQGERVARFPDATCASRVRSLVYADLLAALRQAVLSPQDRRRCLELLRSADSELPSLRTIAYFTLAEQYALLQARALGQRLPIWRTNPVTWRTSTPAQLGELIAERDALRVALEPVAEQPAWPFTVENYARVCSLGDAGAAMGAPPSAARYATMLLPLVRCFLTEIETLRRGTRLVFELFAYRDGHGSLPGSLDALGEVPAWCKIDPFGGGRLVYVPDGESFRLYSVAADCVDSGGVHNPDCGRRGSGGDYVIWPTDEPKPR